MSRAIQYVAQTGSTNADLIARLRASEPLSEGFWIVADRQTTGRGRQGRTWFDGGGNFMGSTLVHCAAGDPPLQSLALVAGLAVRAACLPHVPDERHLQLKWPNDLLLGGAKLAGILLEGEGQSVVIGVGANLAVAPEIEGRPAAALGGLSRDEFAEQLADSLATEIARWRSDGIKPVIARWEAAAHPRGTSLSVHEAGGDRTSGTFDGLDENGALRLRTANGLVKIVYAGDVALESGE